MLKIFSYWSAIGLQMQELCHDDMLMVIGGLRIIFWVISLQCKNLMFQSY